MKLLEVNQLEKAVCYALRLDGWDLEWSEDQYEHYDAKGFTPKGHKCVIEMKFVSKYYDNKLLEKYKYDKLMQLPKDIIKIYFVNDPVANYFFWLDSLVLGDPVKLELPATTLWDQNKRPKLVYFLEESQASIINKNSNYAFTKSKTN